MRRLLSPSHYSYQRCEWRKLISIEDNQTFPFFLNLSSAKVEKRKASRDACVKSLHLDVFQKKFIRMRNAFAD